MLRRAPASLVIIGVDLKKTSPAYGRILGFRTVVSEAGLDSREFLTHLGNEYSEIEPRMMRIFEEIEKDYPGRKKGIFVSNDTAANVLLNLVLKRYGKLPDEYLIIGFDDSPISRETVIPISTIRQDIRTMADTAMELLIRQMKEGKRSSASKQIEHRIINTELVIRETTVRMDHGKEKR